MPTLNGMQCSIELNPHPYPLEEQGITYGDRTVQCFVCVPSHDTPFCIRFTASGAQPTGLAVFVFIDGQYQANRNKTSLNPLVSPRAVQMDVKFRQKEEVVSANGSIIGREWCFSQPHTGQWISLVVTDVIVVTNHRYEVTKPEDASHVSEDVLANLGTIEVVVLRCKGALNYGSASDYSQARIQTPLAALCNIRAARSGHRAAALSDVLQTADPSAHSKAYWNDLATDHNHVPTPGSRRSPHMSQWPAYEKPKLLQQWAESQGIDTQVAFGPGSRYSHLDIRPIYLDDMQSPFAVFTFVYRSEAFFRHPTSHGNEVASAKAKSTTSHASHKSDGGWGNTWESPQAPVKESPPTQSYSGWKNNPPAENTTSDQNNLTQTYSGWKKSTQQGFAGDKSGPQKSANGGPTQSGWQTSGDRPDQTGWTTSVAKPVQSGWQTSEDKPAQTGWTTSVEEPAQHVWGTTGDAPAQDGWVTSTDQPTQCAQNGWRTTINEPAQDVWQVTSPGPAQNGWKVTCPEPAQSGWAAIAATDAKDISSADVWGSTEPQSAKPANDSSAQDKGEVVW